VRKLRAESQGHPVGPRSHDAHGCHCPQCLGKGEMFLELSRSESFKHSHLTPTLLCYIVMILIALCAYNVINTFLHTFHSV
jgi:hypothetical protein